MDRAHRIGQTREVSVFRLCTDGTIEEKVIEKAYKKLRLDALVIQQGRLTQNTKSMNKDELLNMVRYGAERIFSGEGSSITDEDIDAIIRKGEQETQALNSKMQQFAEGAMKFSLNGDLSAYDYKVDAEEQQSKKEVFRDLKTIMAHSWVDPPKRQRKQNYSDAEYFKQTMGESRRRCLSGHLADGASVAALLTVRPWVPFAGGGGGGKKKETSLVKRQVVADFQFYNRARINELYDKEEAYLRHEAAAKEKEEAMRKQGLSDEEIKAAVEEHMATRPAELTEEEREERERLLEVRSGGAGEGEGERSGGYRIGGCCLERSGGAGLVAIWTTRSFLALGR